MRSFWNTKKGVTPIDEWQPGCETIVIDYKTGDSQTIYSKYKEQVKEYIDLLKRAGYENVKGYLWYVMDNKVVPVSDSNND